MQLTNRAPLVATDELEEECERGLEDPDHEEGVQHPTGYEPLKRRQGRKGGKNPCDELMFFCQTLSSGSSMDDDLIILTIVVKG